MVSYDNPSQRHDACGMYSHRSGDSVNTIRGCDEQRPLHAGAQQPAQHRAAVAGNNIIVIYRLSQLHLHTTQPPDV